MTLYFDVTARQASELLGHARALATQESPWRPTGYLVNGFSVSYLPADPTNVDLSDPNRMGTFFVDSDQETNLRAFACVLPEHWAAELLAGAFDYRLL